MLAQKKILSLEELEAQTMVALPDRELLHVHKGGAHKGGAHHAAAAPTTTTTTTTTTSTMCSQDNSHSNDALLSIIPIFVPTNAPFLSCNNVTF
jgi:hypothetical protein